MNKNLTWVLILFMTPIAAYVFLLGAGNLGLFTSAIDTPSLPAQLSVIASRSGDNVIIQATANDDSDVGSIIIYIDGSEAQKCTTFNNPRSAICQFSGRLSPGPHRYKAFAQDATSSVTSQDQIINV